MNPKAFSAANVRGDSTRTGTLLLPKPLRERPLSALSDAELATHDAIGRGASLKMHG